MHPDLQKVVLVSAADTPNIDSAGAVAEFIPVLPFVVTRVGILATTAVNPDNSVAMTAALSRRITVGSPAGPLSYPAPPRDRAEPYRPVPGLGEHTEEVRREFAPIRAGSIE